MNKDLERSLAIEKALKAQGDHFYGAAGSSKGSAHRLRSGVTTWSSAWQPEKQHDPFEIGRAVPMALDEISVNEHENLLRWHIMQRNKSSSNTYSRAI